jgi:predicted cobalt transporter CbtA
MARMLRHGAVAGMAGGAALALFLQMAGEPSIRRAIALESARSAGARPEELFGRGAQELGGVVGAVLYGLCLGMVTAVVLASVRHRMATREEWRAAMLVGAVGFLTVGLVPFLKYPANPPGVGGAETVGRRTALFLAMVCWSVLASWCSWRLWCHLRERGWPEHRRLAAVAAGHAALVTAAFLLLPTTGDPATVPATLLWRFRLASLVALGAFWAVSAWTLGWLLAKAANQRSSGATTARPAPAAEAPGPSTGLVPARPRAQRRALLATRRSRWAGVARSGTITRLLSRWR